MVAPTELKEKWKELDRTNTEEYESFIQELVKRRVAIPTTYECACNRKPAPEGYFFPVTLTMGAFKNNVMVLWIESDDVQPIIGRLGVFDKVNSVVFKKKELFGYFEL